MNNLEVRNTIKSYLALEGMSMKSAVKQLAEKYGWNNWASIFSAKLRNGTLCYKEAIELDDLLGYDIVWQKRKWDSR